MTPCHRNDIDLQKLPKVTCQVRARIPTSTGIDTWLYLYQNDSDDKEHLALVLGNSVWSRSLHLAQNGETELDRQIRGAYHGILLPEFSGPYSQEIMESRSNRTGLVNQEPVGMPLVRVHSECFTGETLLSTRCDCGEQFQQATQMIIDSIKSTPTSSEKTSAGVIIYLRQEGRGIGLKEKLKTFNLQDLGSNTLQANLILNHPADGRDFGVATAILVDLGLGALNHREGICLLTNNPEKLRTVQGPNREVIIQRRVPVLPISWQTNGKEGLQSPELSTYLNTKVRG